jgi:hypothetical protein
VDAETESTSLSSMLKIIRSRRMPALFTTMCSAPNVSMRLAHHALGRLPVGDALGVGDGLAAGRLDLGHDGAAGPASSPAPS